MYHRNHVFFISYLEQFQENPHGMIKKGLILLMTDNDIETVIKFLSSFQFVFILCLAIT